MHTGSEQRPYGIPLWMPIVGLFSAAISFFWMRQDHLAASVLVAVGTAGFSGYRMGALKLMGLVAGTVAAIMLAPSWGRIYEPYVQEQLHLTGLTNRIACIGVIGIGLTLVASVTASLLGRTMLCDRPRLESFNRWSGFLLGGVQGCGIVLLLLGGIQTVEPLAKQRLTASEPAESPAQIVSQRIVQIAQRTRTSQLGPVVAAYNPLEHVPQLKQIQDSLQLVRDPEQINRAMQSPRMEQLKQRPSMQQAIDSLAADQQIQNVLRSGKPLTPQTAMSLMNNPTILKLLDQPEVVGEFTRLASELKVTPQVPGGASRTGP